MALVGMRTVKTAVAVGLGVFIAQALNLQSPFFVAIAAIITLQGNLVDSFGIARDRMLGTVFGALMGLGGAWLAPGNPFVVGLGVALIIYILNLLKWNRAIVIATVVFVYMMVGYREDPSLMDSLHRMLDTFVGIVVAVVVNFAISRPYSRDRVVKSATGMVLKSMSVVRKLICQQGSFSLEDIAAELDVLERELPALKKEVKLHIVRADSDKDFDRIKNQFDELYQNIFLLAQLQCSRQLNIRNSKLVNRLYRLDTSPAVKMEEEDIVFNYHLGIILELLEELSRTFNVSGQWQYCEDQGEEQIPQ